jgi:hypothetical protein
MRREHIGPGSGRSKRRERRIIVALQIARALLYYWELKLTLSAQLGSLFGTIALVRNNPREQVSGGLFIKTQTLTAIGG